LSSVSHQHAAPIATLFPYTTLFRSKTRFALEVCRDAPWKRSVVYVPSLVEANPLQLLTAVANTPGKLIVLVVDEVPSSSLLALKDRKSTRLNSSHDQTSYAVFCLKK